MEGGLSERMDLLARSVKAEGERVEKYYQWVATDLHFPMKLAKKDGSWIVEYQHVKMRPVSDYLFNLPVNFHPLEEFDKIPGGPSKEP